MSELADELGLEAGNMSRQVRLYYRLKGQDKPARLDGKAVDDLRSAHALVSARTVQNYPQALKRVLGLSDAPVPHEAVIELRQTVHEVHDSQLRMEKRLNGMARQFKALLIRLEQRGDHDDEASVEPAAEPT